MYFENSRWWPPRKQCYCLNFYGLQTFVFITSSTLLKCKNCEYRYESIYVVLTGMKHRTMMNEWKWLVNAKRKKKISRTYNINIVNHRTSCQMMLLLLSGDIELNPGPIKFPCGICQNAVRDGMRAVCCDECDVWYHVKCYSISNAVYKTLKNSSKSWICCQCGFPNFDSSFFDSSIETILQIVSNF